MQNLKLVSEDSRRRLFEFGEGNWKIAKYLEIKEDCIIGDHYHLEKDECFLLVKGEMLVTVSAGGAGRTDKVEAPGYVWVPRGVYHKFEIKAGSKLVGLCSELFNEKDDFKC